MQVITDKTSKMKIFLVFLFVVILGLLCWIFYIIRKIYKVGEISRNEMIDLDLFNPVRVPEPALFECIAMPLHSVKMGEPSVIHNSGEKSLDGCTKSI